MKVDLSPVVAQYTQLQARGVTMTAVHLHPDDIRALEREMGAQSGVRVLGLPVHGDPRTDRLPRKQ